MHDLKSALPVGQLVRAHDGLDAVARAKGLGDVGAEGGGEGATRRADDHAIALVRVRPQRIEEHVVVLGLQLLRRVAPEIDLADVVERDRRLAEETAVDHEGPLADDRRHGHRVEEPVEQVHQVLVVRVLGSELPAEAAARGKGPLVEVTLLVVAAVDVHAARVGELVGEQQEEDVERVRPAVGDVAVEQVGVRRGRLAVLVKDPEHVVELPMRVAAYAQPLVLGGGRGDALKRALLLRLLRVQRERRHHHLVHRAARDRRQTVRALLVAPAGVRHAEVLVKGRRLLQREGRQELKVALLDRNFSHKVLPRRHVRILRPTLAHAGEFLLQGLINLLRILLRCEEGLLLSLLHVRPLVEIIFLLRLLSRLLILWRLGGGRLLGRGWLRRL